GADMLGLLSCPTRRSSDLLAAYTGKSADNIFLDAIPSILQIRPNWTINYDGLSRINWLKKYIRSFDLSHSYRSTYNIGQFITNRSEEHTSELQSRENLVCR